MIVLNFNYRGSEFTVSRTCDNKYCVFSHTENRQITDGDNLQDSCSNAALFTYLYEDRRKLMLLR